MSEHLTDHGDWNFRGNKLRQDIAGQDFVTSESTLLLVSDVATHAGQDDPLSGAHAVGLTQDASFNQQRQTVQVNEIGSNQKYTISSSRTQDQLNLSRAIFDGRSLLKVLSPHYAGDSESDFGARDKPGYDQFFTNLGSSLFNRPVGLMMVFRDLENDQVGGVFFERAFIVSHNMNISSQSPFLGEGVNILFDELIPMDTNTGGSDGGEDD